MVKPHIVLVMAMMLPLAASLHAEEHHSFWWYTKAKVACLPDVLRLCASAMPSEDKVRDCMSTKQKQVSASCAEFYPGGKNAD